MSHYWSLNLILLLLACSVACSKVPIEEIQKEKVTSDYKYLALGDSYTIGESVCPDCDFPQQLVDSLDQVLDMEGKVDNIAQTGWTTGDLLSYIEFENLDTNYDFVSLLIGVNNQYQNLDFAIFEEEFITLVDKAINYAGGDKSRVFIVSIPDYAFTPFGQNSNPTKISSEIDEYNDYCALIASQRGIEFICITDITREGVSRPELVASDQLHPSAVAYREFVERLFDPVFQVLN